MTKVLPSGVYTQINTNESEYLIQNQCEYDCHIVISASQPTDLELYDFVLEAHHGISSNHIEGICWGKPAGKYNITVGVVEG